MTKIPPPRYRIVERGRRLEVIDTLAGGRAAKATPDTPPPSRPKPGRIRFDGTTAVNTHAFYDEKGPRTIVMTPDRIGIVRGAKVAAAVAILAIGALAINGAWVLLILAALVIHGARKPIRDAVTEWLDQAERESA